MRQYLGKPGRVGRALHLTCALLCAGAPSLSAAQTSPPARAESYLFAFQDAEIAQVVREVFGQLGLLYTIDPAVTGRISFRIEQRLTRAQLLEALEVALAQAGVVMVRDGESLTVTPRSKARLAAGLNQIGPAGLRPGFSVVAVPVSFVRASEVARALEAITGSDALIYSNDNLSLLVLAGTAQEIQSVLRTLPLFDQSSLSDGRLRWHELGQASATVVAAELERIAQGAGLSGVVIAPMKRLNGILIFGRSTAVLDELGKWVGRLDTPAKDGAATLWVYRPKYTSAENLARTVGSVLGGSAQSGASPGGSTAPASVAASPPSSTVAPITANATSTASDAEEPLRFGFDRDSNTILVFAPAYRWVQVQRVLGEVDRPPAQILIEASILEVTLTKEFEFGVDWSLLSGDFAASSINNGDGAVGAAFPGLAITYLKGDIQAAVNTLGTKADVEVISAPKIIALDNKTARLQIGDQVPIVTQSAQSTATGGAPVLNSIDYRNTGVILSVSPRISGENQVVLEVSQEVSSASRTVSSGINSPTIQQRKFESTLVMPNDGVVALGGLISSSHVRSDSGTPYLKDVPVIGNLFKSQINNRSRTELVVLISAHIVRDPAESSRQLTDLFADMKELQARGLLPTAK